MAKSLLSFTFMCCLVTAAARPVSAHPGSAIVVDAKGQVYFVDTGHGVWTVDAEGKLVDLGGPAFHWMALDPDRRFAGLRVQGGSFEFVAKSIDRGVLILSSDSMRDPARHARWLVQSSLSTAIGSMRAARRAGR